MNPAASPFISVVIPNYNGANTIGRCLDAALASPYQPFEIVVVDDCSTDGSAAVIEQYPCRFSRLPEHSGASAARNAGARQSAGELLFFIDSDCLLQPDTLARAAAAFRETGPNTVIGGTYTWLPFDRTFFSTFQSIFIHYSETKNAPDPDYIATHAMLITRDLFFQSGGFNETFMPILEDVEFSHRLKKRGVRLHMVPEIQVQHIFNFTLGRSLRNGIRKARYWSLYSLKNRDLLVDSGTASLELKFNVLACFLNVFLILLAALLQSRLLLLPVPLLFGANLYLNRNLIRAFVRVRGVIFAGAAVLYYTFIYPFAVGLGAGSGMLSHYFRPRS